VTHYAPGEVRLELDAPAPEGAALVIAENYYPGWTARVDGAPAPLGRAQFTLIGVELPAGARNVELSFDNRTFATGKLITLVAIAAVGLWLVMALVMGRRAAGSEVG
jgi:uncharacterized membrane protein YfhO